MKIRTGFITNSSSTNFLIISKEELTEDYLFDKLGFIKDGALETQGRELCSVLINSIEGSVTTDSPGEVDVYEEIMKKFGLKSANVFKKMEKCSVYWGSTGSDEEPIVQFFTTDSFEIEEKDFYVNGRNCMW